MANPWFRMYAEFATDPKVQRMSEQNQRRLLMLFCLRCNDDVTLHDDDVTFMLRVTHEEWTETKAIFIERGFIDKDNNVLNWDKRQFISDSSKNRVAAYRERKKNKGNNDVTLQKQNCNAIDTEQNRTDTYKNITPLAMLKAMGISEALARDWIKVRKEKKQAITQTALDRIKSHAEKHNFTFNEAVKIAVENSWAGFNVSWLDKEETKTESVPDWKRKML